MSLGHKNGVIYLYRNRGFRGTEIGLYKLGRTETKLSTFIVSGTFYNVCLIDLGDRNTFVGLGGVTNILSYQMLQVTEVRDRFSKIKGTEIELAETESPTFTGVMFHYIMPLDFTQVEI